MIKSVLKLNKDEINRIEPISYSLIGKALEINGLKMIRWKIEFMGEHQAILTDNDGRILFFDSEAEANELCKKYWSHLNRA